MLKKYFMSSCQICDRKTRMGANRSHSNIATKRLQKLNLQKTAYQGKRVLACAKCIKTLGKVK